MKKNSVMVMVFICGVFTGLLMGWFVFRYPKKPKVAVLEKDLRITGANPSTRFYLPAGTELILDHVEDNFSVYRLYVNVFGNPLEAKPATVGGYYNPITVFNDDFDEIPQAPHDKNKGNIDR